MDTLKKKNGNKFLVFDSANENIEVLKKYAGLQYVIKNEIETTNECKKGKYSTNFMKVKFNSDNNLPLNKTLKLHNMTISIRFVFEEDYKLYPQVYLGECLYEL